jgi:hypothetical protein
MEPFRTEVPVPSFPFKMDHNSHVTLLGSCFAENIGNLLQQHKIPVLINPFGILFNPFSIVNALERMINHRAYTADELIQRDEVFLSLDHHGRFNHRTAGETLDAINTSLRMGSEALRKSSVIFITLGSAWVYRHRSSGHIVANCHKLPGADFEKQLLGYQDVHLSLRQVPQFLKANKVQAEVIFTVSPVRHWKEGAIGNQRSKAILLAAIHEVVQEYDQCHYFPAYEVMMDDLRDYRFYATDMIHPTAQAIDYVWQKFQLALFTEECRIICREVNSVVEAAQHRPMDPESNSFQRFIKKQLEIIAALEAQYPALNFTEEKRVFQSYQIA